MNNDIQQLRDQIQRLQQQVDDQKRKFDMHFHDGNNSQRVNQSDLLWSPQHFQIEETYPANETDTFNLGFTPTRVVFNGYAYTTTEIAILNGLAIFGQINKNGSLSKTLVQSCNGFYIKLSGSSVAGAAGMTTDTRLASVIDYSSVEHAYLTITAYTSNSVTIQAVIPSGWTLNGNITIS